MARGSNASWYGAHNPKHALADHHKKKVVRRQRQHLLAIKSPDQLREMRNASRVKQRRT